MNYAEINVENLIERADEFVDNTRKVLAATIIFVIVALFVHNAYDCLTSTKSELDNLRSIIEKLSDGVDLVNDVGNVVDQIHNASNDKLNSLKNEINRAMSKMTNGLERNERFDYALEGAGGRIVSHHNSQLMYDCSKLAILSSMCNEVNPPSKAIQSSIEPGQGFCFKGGEGSLTIKLACNVAIDSVTIDHINILKAPIEYISEAPKEFSLKAFKNLDDPYGVDIGKFTFDPSHVSQTFQIFGPPDEKFRYVQVNMSGNYGSEEKTCLYRIRVHGFVDEC